MNILAHMLSLGFMQNAFIAGGLLAILLSTLGVFVTLRRMAFLGEGIAHASLAGIAIAVLADLAPLPLALAWGIGMATAIFVLERKTKLPSDTTIGILFTTSLALGILLMSLTEGYQPELLTYLFGSILNIRSVDVTMLAILSAAILGTVALFRRQFILMSLNEDTARVQGVSTNALTLLLYVMLAVAMVLGVKMLGVILVSALLIIPPATGRLIAGSLKSYVAISIVASLIGTSLGLTFSYLYDLPSGATIVLTCAIGFFFALLWQKS